MNRTEEDEIQVLGTPSKGVQKRKRMVVIVTIVVIVAIISFLFFFISNQNSELQPDSELSKIENNRKIVQADSIQQESMIRIFKDSINDIPLVLYSLVNLKAELSFSMPEKEDSTVFFVVPAADIRRDNKEIVGDYVFKGEQLFTGKRKVGYCAIIDGKVSLGISLNDEVKDYCISNKGYFFRQYILVMNGEMQENKLKGKSLRRALAKQGTDLYIIESCNPESLYDFSEALADIGITEAIYLPGGNSYKRYRDGKDGKMYESTSNRIPVSPHLNYIIFRNKKSLN